MARQAGPRTRQARKRKNVGTRTSQRIAKLNGQSNVEHTENGIAEQISNTVEVTEQNSLQLFEPASNEATSVLSHASDGIQRTSQSDDVFDSSDATVIAERTDSVPNQTDRNENSINNESVCLHNSNVSVDFDDDDSIMKPPETPPEQIFANEATSENVDSINTDHDIVNGNNQNMGSFGNEEDVKPLNTSAILLRGKEVNFKFVPGQRRGSQMIYSNDENQVYKRNKVNKDGSSGWTCIVKNCDERITMRANGKCYYSATKHGHNHEKKDDYQRRVDLKNEIKVECSKVENIASGSISGAVRDVFYSKVTR